MRKLATAMSGVLALVAVTAVADAGPVATDANGNFVVMDVDVSPPRSSHKRKARGVGVRINLAAGNRRTGERSPYNGEFSLRIHKGFKSNAADFPACLLPRNQNEIGMERCPPEAKIGDGTAVADARPTLADPIPVNLTAYNGEAREGNPTVIVIAKGSGSVPLNSEFDLELKQEKTGPYGSVLVSLPPPQGTPQNLFSLSELNLSIPDREVTKRVNGKKVVVHLLEAPTKCNGIWRFLQTMKTPDGAAAITAPDNEGCVKGAKPKKR
jgi:hypothetical protein